MQLEKCMHFSRCCCRRRFVSFSFSVLYGKSFVLLLLDVRLFEFEMQIFMPVVWLLFVKCVQLKIVLCIYFTWIGASVIHLREIKLNRKNDSLRCNGRIDSKKANNKRSWL